MSMSAIVIGAACPAAAPASSASCPWVPEGIGALAGGAPVGGAPAGGVGVIVGLEVAVPPVPLARLGVAVTGMVPIAKPWTEVAVATVVAVPT